MKYSGILMVICLSAVFSCTHQGTPKPRGYFRIDFPQKEYSALPDGFPFSFQLPNYSNLSRYKGPSELDVDSQDWLNVDFPEFSAHIHLTYKEVKNNLGALIEDAHTFAYKHRIKAEAIEQTRFERPESDVFGVLYHIKGNAASSLQFFCTDSVNHFLRGALYFDTEPNKDSLSPVVDFLGEDILKIIETLEWEQGKK